MWLAATSRHLADRQRPEESMGTGVLGCFCYCYVYLLNAAETGRQYVPPSKAVLNVLSNPGKSKHPSSGFLDQRSQSDTDMAVSVCILSVISAFQ